MASAKKSCRAASGTRSALGALGQLPYHSNQFNVTMYIDEKTFTNDSNTEMTIVIEPWGMPHRLSAGQSIRVIGSSEQSGFFEVETSTANIIVYAWPGAIYEVISDGLKIDFSNTSAPPVPNNTTTRQMVQLLFRDHNEPQG